MLRDRCPVSVCLCLSVCLSVTLVYRGQTVGWMKMPLGMEVGFGPVDIVYRHLIHVAGKFCENQLKACSLSASISIGGIFSFP